MGPTAAMRRWGATEDQGTERRRRERRSQERPRTTSVPPGKAIRGRPRPGGEVEASGGARFARASEGVKKSTHSVVLNR
ncbi:hypothetical protein NL676_000590 [Syzygium grande]|nr:hypothetical protein NL676_000590 [Syzygium grande]